MVSRFERHSNSKSNLSAQITKPNFLKISQFYTNPTVIDRVLRLRFLLAPPSLRAENVLQRGHLRESEPRRNKVVDEVTIDGHADEAWYDQVLLDFYSSRENG